jgi:hypothetical protein
MKAAETFTRAAVGLALDGIDVQMSIGGREDEDLTDTQPER